MKEIKNTLTIGFTQEYASMGAVGVGINIKGFTIFTSSTLPMLLHRQMNYWGVAWDLIPIGNILDLPLK